MSDENLSIPEYKINLLNKNKKIIKKIENIEKTYSIDDRNKKNYIMNNKNYIPRKKFKKPDQKERKALEKLITQLKKISQNTPAEEIQTIIYSTGKENGYKENLRDWFKLIYQVTFGEENGPRMGFFISFFGVKETIDLMEKKLKI